MSTYLPYLGTVLACAALASYFTSSGLQSKKYLSIKKPSWYPRGYAFGIAWTIIYLLYSYSWSKTINMFWMNILFWINIILNVLWCYVFFSLGDYTLALGVLIALVGTLVLQIVSFYKYDNIATVLLIPYLLWCCFASYLNYTIVMIN